jgi:hypothetical protein
VTAGWLRASMSYGRAICAAAVSLELLKRFACRPAKELRVVLSAGSFRLRFLGCSGLGTPRPRADRTVLF